MTTTNNFIPIVLALSLAATSLACPTRTDGSADGSGTGGSETQTGGHGGSSRPDAGTGGSAGGGGIRSVSGDVGAGGSGLAGMGGMAGAIGTGGTAGVIGTGGTAGATGTGGSPATCSPACTSATQTCVGTKCLLNDGQTCALASQCASNVCTPFYVDQDGDGYGTGPASGFCGTTPPVGYSAQTGDCCDTASNLALAKLIHPNAGFQTTSAGGVCGVTWDYDCDGTIETSESMGECDPSATYPTCTRALINYPQSDCGTMQLDYTCEGETVPDSIGPGTMNVCAGSSIGPGNTLGCR